jgi:hypothetical protein
VDKVFIGQSSASFGAANRRQFYVSVSRGREQALVFTDDKKGLLKAALRHDEPSSAHDLVKTRTREPELRERLKKRLAFIRRLANFTTHFDSRQTHLDRASATQREIRHAI